jgi:hypothetical protein
VRLDGEQLRTVRIGMLHRTHALVVASVLFLQAAPALAKDVAGVNVAESAAVGDAKLVLNGAGLRSKAIFKVYVGSLYVVTPSKDPKKLLASDTARRQVMHFLRDVDATAIVGAWREGFTANAPNPALQSRLDTFCTYWTNVKEGDVAAMTYVPGTGTTLTINGKARGAPVPGKDFADAVLLGWIGPTPPSDDLKNGVLGK